MAIDMTLGRDIQSAEHFLLASQAKPDYGGLPNEAEPANRELSIFRKAIKPKAPYCFSCEKGFDTMAEFEQHTTTDDHLQSFDSSHQPWACPICRANCNTPADQEEQLEQEHSVKLRLSCPRPDCAHSCCHPRLMDAHVVIDHDNEKYTCTMATSSKATSSNKTPCGKILQSYNSFKNHFSSHRRFGQGLHICGLGGRRIIGIPGAKHFEIHRRQHFECCGCGKVLLLFPPETTSLKGHRKFTETIQREHLAICEQKPEYESIGNAFTYAIDLDDHRPVREGPGCDYTTHEPNKLRNHRGFHEVCGDCFVQLPMILSVKYPAFYVSGQLYNSVGVFIIIEHLLDTCDSRHTRSELDSRALKKDLEVLSPLRGKNLSDAITKERRPAFIAKFNDTIGAPDWMKALRGKDAKSSSDIRKKFAPEVRERRKAEYAQKNRAKDGATATTPTSTPTSGSVGLQYQTPDASSTTTAAPVTPQAPQARTTRDQTTESLDHAASADHVDDEPTPRERAPKRKLARETLGPSCDNKKPLRQPTLSNFLRLPPLSGPESKKVASVLPPGSTTVEKANAIEDFLVRKK